MIYVLIAVLVVVVLALLFFVLIYNGLIRKRNACQNAWAQVDVQLKRRHDLIPNLIESVKGYAAHERGTFDEVTQARTAAQKAQGPAEQGQAENILTQALGKLFAVAEAYPQLRATENFQQLQAQLAETEDKIQVSRQMYNDTTLTYNNAIQTVPTNIVAGMFSFQPRAFFEVEGDAEREAPQVSFATTEPQPPTEPGAPSTPPQT